MQPARRTARQTTNSEQPARNRMIAAIQITWKNLRPDLHHSPDELREERLTFISSVLRSKRPVTSMRTLSDRQLGLVLDAMRNFESQPSLPACEPVLTGQAQGDNGAEIIHLASAEQVFTITKILDHLRWGAEARESFMVKRFRRKSPSMLSPLQANSLTMILLNIAAGRAVKDRTGATRVSRKMIHAEIPSLKVRLGIDRKEA